MKSTIQVTLAREKEVKDSRMSLNLDIFNMGRVCKINSRNVLLFTTHFLTNQKGQQKQQTQQTPVTNRAAPIIMPIILKRPFTMLLGSAWEFSNFGN